MGKAKHAKRKEEIEADVQEQAEAPYRPPTEPWSTSLGNGRWALHQASVPIVQDDGTPEGMPTKVRNTLDTTGAPELSAALVERLDAHSLRPAFSRYLRESFRSNDRLAPLLPLSPAEAMTLLRQRDGELHFIVTRCEPAGDMSAQDMGEQFLPPVHGDTIERRRDTALRMLRTWVRGSSYRPRISRTRTSNLEPSFQQVAV